MKIITLLSGTFLMLNICLIISCEHSTRQVNVPPQDESYRITPLEFADAQTIRVLRHAEICRPTKFRFEYKTNKKRLNIWLEIWDGSHLTTRDVMSKIRQSNDSGVKEHIGLGEGSFEIEVTENLQLLDRFDKRTINCYVNYGGGGSSGPLRMSIDSFPSLSSWTHLTEEKINSTNQDFYIPYTSYGFGASGASNMEFPHELIDPTQREKRCYVMIKGVFTDSYEELKRYFETKYEKYRPYNSGYDLGWEE